MHREFTRRQFLSLGSLGLAAAALGGWAPRAFAAEPRRASFDPLAYAPVREIAKAIRTKQVSSVEVVAAYLKRIDDVNPWINAVVQLDAEAAIEQAKKADALLARGRPRGPLHGVPMTIKDSLDTKGVITTWGVSARSDKVPTQDATVVARLRDAGAILLGKTNTPELTLSFETNSPVYGLTSNPYNQNRTPGGSSGGAAAIVAAAGAPFDIGSDTGGSVRLPAHFCGVCGLRPTAGRVPRTGNAIPPGGLLDSLTALGPIARHVDDLALLLGIISGPDVRDPATVPVPPARPGQVKLKGLRGTFHTDNGIRTPTRETREAVQSVVKALARTGVSFEERRPPGIEQTLDIFQRLFNWDQGAWRRQLLRRAAADNDIEEPETRPAIETGELLGLIGQWDAFRARLQAFMASFDVLVCPVNAFPALDHGHSADNIDAFSYTMTFSLTNWPAIVIPAGWSAEGLPIGVQIVAPPWREDLVLAAAAHVEQVLDVWRPPDL